MRRRVVDVLVLRRQVDGDVAHGDGKGTGQVVAEQRGQILHGGQCQQVDLAVRVFQAR